MQAVQGKSRDGFTLVSYLTLPAEIEADRPPRPLPMVLIVHGGPWGRDIYGYRRDHQWLADRGYAVLSVNYRGSTGFGKAFVAASEKEHARKMHDDLIDMVDWAIAVRHRAKGQGRDLRRVLRRTGLIRRRDLHARGVLLFGAGGRHLQPANAAGIDATLLGRFRGVHVSQLR
jgi:dienelactone hydrolase